MAASPDLKNKSLLDNKDKNPRSGWWVFFYPPEHIPVNNVQYLTPALCSNKNVLG